MSSYLETIKIPWMANHGSECLVLILRQRTLVKGQRYAQKASRQEHYSSDTAISLREGKT